LLRRRDFYHQRIKYSFHYHKDRIQTYCSNRNEFKKLESYFKEVYKGNIPNNLFNSKNIQRVSQFKIKGIKKTFLNSFSKQLIRSKKIIILKSGNELSNYAKNVYENYLKNKIKSKPGHDPILKNILIKDKKSIAIEVPIWRKINGNIITGHIDLMQIENETLKIIDYKPEGQFLYSLPQVATYGLLVKVLLKTPYLKCISFNKAKAWEYDPVVLLTDIRKYLISHGITTREWEKYI